MRKALVAILVLAGIAAGGPVAELRAESSNTACAHIVAAPAPGATGSTFGGIFCQHQTAPLATWVVPAGVISARFSVHGADDPGRGASGGHVQATLQVTPGTTMTLTMGGSGEASAVSLGDAPLILAAGGSGDQPNFVTPSASEVGSEDPGAPLPPFPAAGRIYVEWGGSSKGPPPEEEPPRPPKPSRCVVPHLGGLKPVAARRALGRADCTLGKLTRRPARRSRLGRIVRQFPTAGTRLTSGAAVNVVVGRRR